MNAPPYGMCVALQLYCLPPLSSLSRSNIRYFSFVIRNIRPNVKSPFHFPAQFGPEIPIDEFDFVLYILNAFDVCLFDVPVHSYLELLVVFDSFQQNLADNMAKASDKLHTNTVAAPNSTYAITNSSSTDSIDNSMKIRLTS